MPRIAPELKKLDVIAKESASRPVRRRALEVQDYTPKDPRPETHLALEGTITVLASRSGSALMAEIRGALKADPAQTEAVARRLYQQYKGRKSVELARAVKAVVSQPVFADVLHGDRLLVENLFVPKDLEVAWVPFPYNGGALAEGGLVLVEHPASDEVEPLDILVLRHAPKLSRAEIAALGKVPVEQNVSNVGRSLVTQACSVVLLTALVVAEVAIVAVTFAITGKVDLQHADREHLDAQEIKKLGVGGSARLLVEKRRELLSGKRQKQVRS